MMQVVLIHPVTVIPASILAWRDVIMVKMKSCQAIGHILLPRPKGLVKALSSTTARGLIRPRGSCGELMGGILSISVTQPVMILYANDRV